MAPSPNVRNGRSRHLGLVVAIGVAGVATAISVPSLMSEPDGIFQWALYAYCSLVYTAVGAIILVSRPRHRLGRLILGIGVAFSVAAILTTAIVVLEPLARSPTTGALTPLGAGMMVGMVLAAALPAFGLLFGATLLIVWFPDGRRSSRLGAVTEVFVAISVAAALVVALGDPLLEIVGYHAWLSNVIELTNQAVFVAFIIAFALALLDLVSRYRRADAVRRAQMRWLIVTVGGTGAATLALYVFGESADWLWAIWLVSTTLPIIGVAIAITRYRLYDIDRIVSRSISYAVITVVLFGVFATVNLVVTQIVASVLPNEARTVGVALSTLVVASLFQPLRGRIQSAVDLRFHRSRYDAQLTVDGFAERLRGQVDLLGLRRELQTATIDAVEPASTAVWLRRITPR